MPTETPWWDAMASSVPEGYVLSRLTGMPIPEETASFRPLAVVVNNIYRALPQSGISQADVIIEVLAEGDITRLVGIFQSTDLPKIGPVRSARDYFVDFAWDYDAFFVHHGGSPSGYERMRTTGINRLDGMAMEGTCFWRERTYPDWYTHNSGSRPLEHSSYTGSELLRAVTERQGFRTVINEDARFGFTFVPKDAFAYMRTGEATEITVAFSPNYTRRFEYDQETSLYTVLNRDGPHMDAETAEPVRVRNIIIQLVRTHVIAGDPELRRHVQTVGQGSGFLIKDGHYQRITWEKDSHTEPIRWYFMDRSEMRLSTGRTWVNVFQENGEIKFGDENNDG
jgi:hypothetical protein